MPDNDPDGAAARMTNFISAMGGTPWAGVQTQYYETVNGENTYITNPTNQLGGVWYDDTNPIHNNVTGLELAQEAQRAVAHFGVTDLKNSQFVIAQPQKFNEAGFNDGAGYCAWHDYTQPQYYPGVQAGDLVHEHAVRPQPGLELRPELRQLPATTPAGSTASRSCSVTRSRRRSPTPAPRT